MFNLPIGRFIAENENEAWHLLAGFEPTISRLRGKRVRLTALLHLLPQGHLDYPNFDLLFHFSLMVRFEPWIMRTFLSS